MKAKNKINWLMLAIAFAGTYIDAEIFRATINGNEWMMFLFIPVTALIGIAVVNAIFPFDIEH